jgi:glycine dehydrogenase subunit 1
MNSSSSKNSNQETEILQVLGKKSTAEFFNMISQKTRFSGKLDLPEALSEPEVLTELKNLASRNQTTSDYLSFLGAGSYHHYIPAVVPAVCGRSEFYTAYTPYQPEISQGILQAIFEYQTMICELTGLEVSNASLYDGATALAEAVRMARNFTGREKILVDPYLAPNYLKLLKTYGYDFLMPELRKNKFFYGDDLKAAVSEETAAVIISQPNFLGQVNSPVELGKLAQAARQKGVLLIVVFAPISLGILEAPGNYGADIAVGEGQPLGLALNFGGPYLGLIAAREKFSRLMPGRIVGKTVDARGERGFVLTLQTREQHIRRERATSNICSNEALCGLAAAVYLSWLGPAGLKRVAELCLERAVYAEKKLSTLENFSVLKEGPFFNEIVLQTSNAGKIQKELLKKKIFAGVDLGKFYPELKNCLLLAFTEMNSFGQIDRLVEELKNAV